MKTKNGYLRVFCTALLILLTGFGVSGDEGMRLSGAVFRQGDFFQVKVDASKTASVQVSFLGVTQQLQYTDQGNFTGLVAVSYYATPGDHALTVAVKDENETLAGASMQYTHQITILKRHFTESRIKVPEKTRAEILTPEHLDFDTQKANEVREKARTDAVPPLWSGVFIWPLKGKLTTDFGLTRFVNDIDNGRHSGLDIAAPKGTPVIAANNGRVIFAGNLYQTGLTVILHHGMNLYTTYGHFSAIKIPEGAYVSKGDVVGLVGATGLATGAHLHLTFRVGDIPVDPYLLLDKELGWDF